MFLIYTIIILLIIFNAFYKNLPFIKLFSIRKNIEILTTSTQIESLSFYFNLKKINSFCFFINFILIILINCLLIPDFFLNTVFCQDFLEEEKSNSNSNSNLYSYISENENFLVTESNTIIPTITDIENNLKNFDNNIAIIDKILEKKTPLFYKKCLHDIRTIHKVNSFQNSYLFNAFCKNIIIKDFPLVIKGLNQNYSNIYDSQKKLIIEINNMLYENLLSTNEFKNIFLFYEKEVLKMLYIQDSVFKKIYFNNFDYINKTNNTFLNKNNIIIKIMQNSNHNHIDTKIIKNIVLFWGINPYFDAFHLENIKSLFLSSEIKEFCNYNYKVLTHSELNLNKFYIKKNFEKLIEEKVNYHYCNKDLSYTKALFNENINFNKNKLLLEKSIKELNSTSDLYERSLSKKRLFLLKEKGFINIK
jgi:hypothetical protein